VSKSELVPQWAVSAAFNDGAKASRDHVMDKFRSLNKTYSVSENLLLHDFLTSVFDADYHEQMVSDKNEAIKKWCFGEE
jgi:hypothetical protein